MQKEINDLRETLEDFEIQSLLSEEMDKNNALLTIHPGAGGTESQDWAQMLLRMYLRWAEKHNFITKIIEHQIGDEAGIKSATITDFRSLCLRLFKIRSRGASPGKNFSF